jgi:hypothetical protein
MSADKTQRDPWTDPDPQPGDFDPYLDEMEITRYAPGEGPKVTFIDTDDVDGWLRERRARRKREAQRETA